LTRKDEIVETPSYSNSPRNTSTNKYYASPDTPEPVAKRDDPPVVDEPTMAEPPQAEPLVWSGPTDGAHAALDVEAELGEEFFKRLRTPVAPPEAAPSLEDSPADEDVEDDCPY